MNISPALRTASCACLSALALAVAPAPAHAAPTAAASRARIEDATSYARSYGVELDEALRRLELQRTIGELDAQLRRDEPASYAGLWIEHEPRFRVVIRFTDAQAEARLQSRLTGGNLAALVELRRASLSLAELSAQQSAALQAARDVNAPVDSQLDVFDNRVEVFTTDTAAFDGMLANALLSLPAGVVVQSAPRLAEPLLLRGGDAGNGCTGGFTVRTRFNEVGISTAAHCPNEQVYNGLELPFSGELQASTADVQWNSACGIDDVSNDFETGFGLRPCTGVQFSERVPVGAYVCKYGMITGGTCGVITSKEVAPSYIPAAAPSFVRVTNRGIKVADRGDSGGPWFSDNDAIGLTSGGYPDSGDAIYMPIDFTRTIGVDVLTYDPGPGCTIVPPEPPTAQELCIADCRADRDDCLSDPDGPRASQCTAVYNACVAGCRRDFP